MVNKQLVIGIDLSEKYTLISICHDPSEGVITYSPDRENENFKIPAAAFRVPGSGRYVFGEEAVKSAAAFNMDYETGLFEKACESAKNGGLRGDDPAVILLGKFISHLLRLPPETAMAKVNALTVAVRRLHALSGKVMEAAIKSAGIGIPSVRVISYGESFFYYALSQPIGLWRDGVHLYDYTDSHFVSGSLSIDHSTTPALVRNTIKSREDMVPFFGSDRRRLDEKFLSIAMEDLKHGASGTYLTGEAFNERWEQRTLRYICSRSRVFKGQNLYSKGACYAAANDVDLIRISRRYVYIGDDSLVTNVSIRAVAEGKEVLLTVADAGEKWFDAGSSMELMLGHDRELILVLTDISDRNERNKVIRLDWLPVRPDRAGRIKADFRFLSRDRLLLGIKDLGFGEIFKSSGKEKEEEIML